MRPEEDAAQMARRLSELAGRAAQMGRAVFTPFLSPAEAEWAGTAARKQGVNALLEGGYEGAERRIACFLPEDAETEPFPIATLEVSWPHQSAPAHRDLLGSVMGLGIKRQCVGDIVLEEQRAFLFAESAMAGHLCDTLLSAGKTRLQVRRLEAPPPLEPPEGAEVGGTVSSLRLDALMSCGFNLSRARAAALIEAGQAKLQHLPVERPDARVQEGDAISLRGFGRLVVSEVKAPTKKGRLPVRLARFGERRGR